MSARGARGQHSNPQLPAIYSIRALFLSECCHKFTLCQMYLDAYFINNDETKHYLKLENLILFASELNSTVLASDKPLITLKGLQCCVAE